MLLSREGRAGLGTTRSLRRVYLARSAAARSRVLEERLVRQPHKFRGRMRTTPISPEKLYCRRDGRVN